MRIVLDSNILFAALIKDSMVRKIILQYDGKFLFPSFIFDELEKHKTELLTKSGLQREEFDHLLKKILGKVEVVPPGILGLYKERAFEIMKDIDLDDVLFIACALHYKGCAIWSDDKDMKKQTEIKVLTTREIVNILQSN
ncbi:PIN domain-containing protein [Candidatus Woesearchaeota archaeon]|nr:PIN domain-containing protein [Candidatus Woesearchaeota archaeon]